MMMIPRNHAIILFTLLAITGALGGESKRIDPEAVAAGFDQRRDALFRADSGKPLEQSKILHLYLQKVGQGDGEKIENLPPTEISILEWKPE